MNCPGWSPAWFLKVHKSSHASLGLVSAQHPGPSHRLVADMPLGSRTQPRPSSSSSGAAFVASVPEQIDLRGLRTSMRPGQVQTTRLAPKSRSIGAGKMPIAPVTTDVISTLLRGPGSRHPCWEFRTQQKAISLPHWEAGVGFLEVNDASQHLMKETSRTGRTRANEWSGESRVSAKWSHFCYQYDVILKGSEDIGLDTVQQEQCMAPLRTGWHQMGQRSSGDNPGSP